MSADAGGSALAAMGAQRSALLIEMLNRLDDEELQGRSLLPEWSRLTIVCHLRYGASTLARMTRDTLVSRPTSWYPQGRTKQRPTTLEPRPGESPSQIVAGFATAASGLDTLWQTLNAEDWLRDVTEPADNPDLGTIPLAGLAMSRLFEVDVHGTDLGIGFPDWTDALVEAALPARLVRLATRRTNHREFDRTLRGSWLLVAPSGLRWLVAVDGERVESRTARTDDRPTATINAAARDLLALLLGRPHKDDVTIDGDVRFGRAFSVAFPGP